MGDVNDDDNTDVIVGITATGIEVFLQNDAGGLDPGVLHDSPNADKLRIIDMNNDGRLDIVGLGTFYAGDKVIDVFLQKPDGTMPKHPVTYRAAEGFLKDMNVGDLNNDGRIDVVVTGWMFTPAADIAVLYQQADGSLAAPIFMKTGDRADAAGAVIGDINADGLSDLVVTSDANQPDAAVVVFSQTRSGGRPPQSLNFIL